ncbi:MAG: CDP-alcohol phosphatidyltransferase family protein [Nostochopsis sp.]
MPSIYQLKPVFQNQLRPLVNRLATAGVTANQVTVVAIALSSLTGGAIAIWHQREWLLLLVPLALFVRMALNAIDGMLAHEHDMKTPLGAILNELGDVVADAVLYLPFSLIPGISGIFVVPIVILSVISELAGVLGVTTGGKRQYDGPMGKSDRAFVFSLVALFLTCGLTPGIWLDILWIGVIALLVWTIVNRVLSTLKEVQNHGMDAPTG